jgi:NAD(P)H-dependent FMN reductase
MLLEVIIGTTREGRFSEKVAAWTMEQLARRDDLDVELVDLRDHPLPFFEGMSPMWTGRDYPNEDVARFGRIIDRADAFLVLVAEYNHGYPAVLKNAMDWTFVEWRRKPISFVSWGNVGGARAVEQLRQVAVEFEMAPIRQAVHLLPDVMVASMQAEDPDDLSVFGPMKGRLRRAVDDLEWWTAALAEARAARPQD